jgi:uncharacterized membrane protein YesL
MVCITDYITTVFYVWLTGYYPQFLLFQFVSSWELLLSDVEEICFVRDTDLNVTHI